MGTAAAGTAGGCRAPAPSLHSSPLMPSWTPWRAGCWGPLKQPQTQAWRTEAAAAAGTGRTFPPSGLTSSGSRSRSSPASGSLSWTRWWRGRRSAPSSRGPWRRCWGRGQTAAVVTAAAVAGLSLCLPTSPSPRDAVACSPQSAQRPTQCTCSTRPCCCVRGCGTTATESCAYCWLPACTCPWARAAGAAGKRAGAFGQVFDRCIRHRGKAKAGGRRYRLMYCDAVGTRVGTDKCHNNWILTGGRVRWQVVSSRISTNTPLGS
mmetsp:Transcript_34504/g.76100  ORF Transcript_34504/g.76100 Transcript_34504/m.76100 type:complete len:263 (+) Transcript_34504:272-1060(+)